MPMCLRSEIADISRQQDSWFGSSSRIKQVAKVPSLRSEIADISRMQDSWFGSSSGRKQTRRSSNVGSRWDRGDRGKKRKRLEEEAAPPPRVPSKRNRSENGIEDEAAARVRSKINKSENGLEEEAATRVCSKRNKSENGIDVVANDQDHARTEVNDSNTDLDNVQDRDYLAFLNILTETETEKEPNLDIIEPDDNVEDDMHPEPKLDIVEQDDNVEDGMHQEPNLDIIEQDDNVEDDMAPSPNLDTIEPVDNVEDEIDPDYKMFIENTKQCGYSYVFEMKNADGTSVLIKYEDHIKKKKKPNKEDRKMKKKKKKKPRVDNSRQRNNPAVDTPSQKNQQNFIVTPNVDALGQQIPKTEPPDNESGRSTKKGHWFISDCKPEAISNADESYLKFLNQLWVTDGSLVYEHGDLTVNYDDYNEGVEIDCEPPGRTVSRYNNEKSFTPIQNQPTHMDEDDPDDVQILDDTTVKFHYKEKLKLKLKEVLQIPFNENELEEKLTAAGNRKPLERTRIMRGRAVSYPTDRTSSSYLDLHPDLAGMLRSADPERSLALLRCLFFYYENVSHQGSFIPWRNPKSWLHEMICSCGENINCPMKHNQSEEKEVWAEE